MQLAPGLQTRFGNENMWEVTLEIMREMIPQVSFRNERQTKKKKKRIWLTDWIVCSCVFDTMFINVVVPLSIVYMVFHYPGFWLAVVVTD